MRVADRARRRLADLAACASADSPISPRARRRPCASLRRCSSPIARAAGSRPQDKAAWEEKAVEDRARYEEECEAAGIEPKKKKEKADNPAKVSKPKGGKTRKAKDDDSGDEDEAEDEEDEEEADEEVRRAALHAADAR